MLSGRGSLQYGQVSSGYGFSNIQGVIKEKKYLSSPLFLPFAAGDHTGNQVPSSACPEKANWGYQGLK